MSNKLKYSVLSLAVTFAIVLAVSVLAVTSARAGTAYYVDCSAGSNGSGSQASPWNTLASVNGHTFVAGDQILFKRGTTCSGQQLYPKGSGSSGSPIIMDAYGTGNLPIIAGNGAVTDTVYLYNQQYWEIRNLEVTNNTTTAAARRGIRIVLSDFGVGHYYRLTNLVVHNVKGTDDKSINGAAGIMFAFQGTATPTSLDDLVIDGVTVYTVDRSGITFLSTWNDRPELHDGGGAWTASTNVIIRNTLAYDIGGDGIVPHYTDGALLEYNIVHDYNVRSAGANVALWCWNCDHANYQYNEFYHGGWNGNLRDSEGMDFDGGNVGDVYQYNYSHDNKGGMILICGWEVTKDNIARYNISQNDGAHIIHDGCDSTINTQFYNNTVYVANPAYSPSKVIFIDPSWLGEDGEGVAFYNNIFYVTTGSGATYDIPTNHKAVFDYNLFYGVQPPSQVVDAHKLTGDPLFVNPGSGGTGLNTVNGYQLQAGSPALCSGMLISNNGGKDFWGNTVSSSVVPDRGANQYSTSCGGATPTRTNTPSGPTPTPNPSNPIQNPGFESGSLSPWNQWNDMSVVNNNQRSGSYALRAGNAQASSEQTVSGLAPSTTYTLVGWAELASSSTGTVNIGVKNYGGSQLYTAITANSYTQASIDFTTGASNTSATIYCYRATGTGYAYCDDFSVQVASSGPTPTPTNTPVNTPTNTPVPSTPTKTATPTNTPIPPTPTKTATRTNTPIPPTPTNTPVNTPTATNTAVPSNLVGNPGFETGSWSPWAPYGTYSIVTTNVHSGSYSAQFTGTDSGAEQTITVSPNSTYLLTGWAKVAANQNTVTIGVKNYGGTQLYQNITSTSYQQKTITFTTGASNTTAVIYCYKSAGSSNSNCDDFSVIKQ